jgi:cytochrome c biogenesis protein CcmG/thiol:disulfide interchange protein DsbE
MSRWLSVIPLVVLAALAALFIGWSLKRDPAVKPDALVGQSVPETVLPILNGAIPGPGHVDLRTAGVGKPMLVNVFASWCLPCRVEHPKLMALKARGVAVVGVAWKDELGDPYAMVLVDREGRAGLDLGITGAPETFAVNAMGQVVAKSSGPLVDDAEIERMVAAIQAPPRPLPTATSH